jgi:hypothetical protein
MTNYVNPYLNDIREFSDLMEKAGIMMEQAKGEQFDFDNEQALRFYDENIKIGLMHWFTRSEKKSYRLSILLLMRVIASQKRHYQRGLPRADGDNVIDFLAYKNFRYNPKTTPLTIGNLGR